MSIPTDAGLSPTSNVLSGTTAWPRNDRSVPREVSALGGGKPPTERSVATRMNSPWPSKWFGLDRIDPRKGESGRLAAMLR
jgi:hypothetical protein